MSTLKPLPASATDLPTSLMGLAAAYSTVCILRYMDPDMPPMFATLLVMASAAFPPVMADLFQFKRQHEASAGLTGDRPFDLGAFSRKCLGLIVTFLTFAAFYFVFPEYHRDMYDRFWEMVWVIMPFFMLITPVYFYWTVKHDTVPHDAYDELAMLAMGKIHGRDWKEIGRHYRNWLVKAFYLPLMITYMLSSVRGMLTQEISITDFAAFYDFGHATIMFADLLFASVGYVLTLRLLNAQIRSSDPTVRGWLVAIGCYTPFWDFLLYERFFAYQNGVFWSDWLRDYPVVQIVWGSSILLLLTIYSLATVCLGIRFSNLTYRGLITTGPYRFTKHPAYLTKNLSWWLTSMPFLNHEGVLQAVVHSAMLLGINFIYYTRARTEELHLSNYPEYVEYALAMNERGITRYLNKLFPFLAYKVPARIPPI